MTQSSPTTLDDMRLTTAAGLYGTRIVNRGGDTLGTVCEILFDDRRARVAYVVTALGGFMGMGERLLAIPWQALSHDAKQHCMRLEMDRKTMLGAPTFHQERWPHRASAAWHWQVHRYFDCTPYWEEPLAAPTELRPLGER